MTSLEGKTALVTGAGQNVGAGIAQALAAAGAAVAVNDIDRERAEHVAAEIAASDAKVATCVFDVTDLEAVRAGVAAVEQELGPVDVLVNNAGIPIGRRTILFSDSEPARDWVPYVDLNVYGALNCVSSVLPGMCDRGRGRIIQISSGSGARGLPIGQSIYGGSKAFCDAFVRHLAIEVAKLGVTVNAVAPGIMSNVVVHVGEEAAAASAAAIPVGRLGEPEDIAGAIVWLASDSADYVTGQVIHVNGGTYQGR